MFERFDPMITVLGVAAFLIGVLRGDMWGVICGMIALISGYPATRLFGFNKEAEG